MMPDTLIVLSDMEFDAATKNTNTNFEQLKKEYNDSGYDLPTLIFGIYLFLKKETFQLHHQKVM